MWQAAKGWPQRTGRIGYLIAFPVLLFVDLAILTALYLTPKRSSAFEAVDLASDMALLFIPIAFGCLLSGILYRKLQKKA